ncbi:uncharacterized protein METZ01_LOCUS122720, partial [marine metagenome]
MYNIKLKFLAVDLSLYSYYNLSTKLFLPAQHTILKIAKMNKTGFLFHPQYLQHDTKSHPENSGRLKAIQEKILPSKIYSQLHLPEPRRAIEDEIKENHNLNHIDHVRNSCRNGEQS